MIGAMDTTTHPPLTEDTLAQAVVAHRASTVRGATLLHIAPDLERVARRILFTHAMPDGGITLENVDEVAQAEPARLPALAGILGLLIHDEWDAGRWELVAGDELK
jgi:hypothetical protein